MSIHLQSLKILPGLSLVIDMRLIDADALKEEVNKKKVVGRFNTLLLIDNAPTVDIFTFDDMKKGINVGYKAGRLTEKWERPQGEWLHDGILDYRCSICNSYPLERGDYPELSAYCPQCGARMEAIRFKDGGTE